MNSTRQKISLQTARHLALSKQHLLERKKNVTAGEEEIFQIVKDLTYLQIDPTSVVARSHLLVLFSRLGKYDTKELDKLLWDEHRLFEYYAHAASIVLTEDYPIHNIRMQNFAKLDIGWQQRIRSWMNENKNLRLHIIRELRKRGPLPSRKIEDISKEGWRSTGWTNERNVNRMLEFLLTKGEIMVAGREGNQKLWHLAKYCLPSWVPKLKLGGKEADKLIAQKSLQALGIATRKQIDFYFAPSLYKKYESEHKRAFEELLDEDLIFPVEIERIPGEYYVHKNDIRLIEASESTITKNKPSATTLLSPFDNLIIDRQRTKTLFGFTMSFEIYVPKHLRKFGYYVMPILHGDEIIGRADPYFDRINKKLIINSIYSETGVSPDKNTGSSISTAIIELAEFLGAKEVVFDRFVVPRAWKNELEKVHNLTL